MKRTPEFYLDEVARKRHYANFENLFFDNSTDANYPLVRNAVKEAMKRYAEDACKDQRQICADNATLLYDDDYLFPNARIDKQTIINAPTPKFEN